MSDDGYCCNCQSLINHINNETNIDSDISDIHKKILELRKSGKSYNEISKELNCAKSTVAYHCNSEIKVGVDRRKEKYKLEDRAKYYFQRRLSHFRNRKRGPGKPPYDKD